MTPVSDWATLALTASPHTPVALITILATEGSAPRGAGTRMAVSAASLSGTIGGGALELRAIEQARAILELAPGSWRLQDYPLGPLLGQCCGGRVRLLVERIDPGTTDWLAHEGEAMVATLTDSAVQRTPGDTAPLPSARGERPAAGASFAEPADVRRLPVMLFGAGHVGRAIARAVERLPVALAWFDPRVAEAGHAGVMLVDEQQAVDCIGEAGAESAILILTHDHGLDYRLTAAGLRSAAGFVGLIGSATKRARFLSRLADDGFDGAARARLTCPIGLAGISGKEPDVIAIAVAAQLLAMRPAA
ncbi:xanthine dehydrogenase accessory factor [Sphingomonas zeicaulis]|uniref:xanthine dehydrogenase accessory protein XdhC n=1 Tax=Sphingomonas zeicaulis TaxID=1632740 RepID=UPI003D2538E1